MKLHRPYHHPGAQLVALVTLAEKDVAVDAGKLVRHDWFPQSSVARVRLRHASLQIGLHRFDQFFGSAATVGPFHRIDDVQPDMILDDFGHQA